MTGHWYHIADRQGKSATEKLMSEARLARKLGLMLRCRVMLIWKIRWHPASVLTLKMVRPFGSKAVDEVRGVSPFLPRCPMGAQRLETARLGPRAQCLQSA